MKNGKIVVAFDVDDTLLIPNVAMEESEFDEGNPHYKNINSYKWFQSQGCYMIVWSGSGVEWAKKWSNEFLLFPNEIREKKKSEDVDLCIDDCTVDLANVNLKVKRVNNRISRSDWNKNKR